MKTKKRCEGCNNPIEEELIDPKGELCNKCYFALDEAPEEAKLFLDIDVKIKKTSVNECIEFLENVACQMADVEAYCVYVFRASDKIKLEREGIS